MNTKEKIFDITKFEQLEENNGILEGGYSTTYTFFLQLEESEYYYL